MTTGKRALIVDDSRSARVILSRMLEQHGMAVDTAESAEQALEYLQQNRPDVIFMDHLMPGMDGLQAVQLIKSDAQTATIPLMMYTSQEGELYVSQARALGAVGVLPKTVRPVDVSRVLYQLHLLPDRRQQRSALFDARAAAAAAAAAATGQSVDTTQTVTADLASDGESLVAAGAGEVGVAATASSPLGAPGAWAVPPAVLSELQSGMRQSIQQLVKDQLAEQRRFMLATFEAFARRMSSEIKEMTRVAPPPPAEPLPPPSAGIPWWPVALTALLAVVPSVILGFLYWQSIGTTATLASSLAETKAQLASAEAAALAAAAPVGDGDGSDAGTVGSSPPSGPLAVEYVPYGETPLAEARLDRLRGLAATLEAQGFRGSIVVESYVGDFCLTGGAGEGFAVADAALPSQDCDLVGNPFEDAISPAQRQSVDFANFAATLRQRTGGAIVVDAVSAGRRSPVEYPEQREGSTAGEWNAVAAQNNRVEFRLVPAP
jgi:CheY-like chemotaxis protein